MTWLWLSTKTWRRFGFHKVHIMKYRAFIDGKYSGPKFGERYQAAAYVAQHHGLDSGDIEIEEEPNTGRGESRSWEVSDNRGDEMFILGYVVEV